MPGLASSPAAVPVPASRELQRIHDEAPPDQFTLAWLVGSLHRRAFGIIILLLAVMALVPGVSIPAGLLMIISSFEMTLGKRAPGFPNFIAAHPLPTRRLATLIQRAIPVLKRVETFVHPRWSLPLEPTKRVVGAVVLLLSVAMVGSPIPFTNVVPAAIAVVISLSYLEDDGALLSAALLAGVVVAALAVAALGEAIRGAEWITHLW